MYLCNTNTDQITFTIWVLFQEYSRFTGQQGKVEDISLTPLYHFDLDISQEISIEIWPLCLASSRNWTGNGVLPLNCMPSSM